MSDAHEGQQRPGVTRGGPARHGAHACKRRRRTSGRVSVLCGGERATQRLVIGVGGDGGRRDWRTGVSLAIHPTTQQSPN